MEVFQNGVIIRLKNCQDKYLIAGQDEESVLKSRDASTKNAQWMVEVVDEGTICLKSCYGKYLTASNRPSIPGVIARNLRVIQTRPQKMNSSHQWLPVSQSGSGQTRSMWLKTPHGSYLQAISGPPPLGNLVTHDLPRKDGTSLNIKKVLWQIEIVDSPSNLWRQSESVMHKIFGVKSFVSEKPKDKEKPKCSKDEKETKKGVMPVYNYYHVRYNRKLGIKPIV